MYIYIWLDKFIKPCDTMMFFFHRNKPRNQPTGEAWAESRITEEDWNEYYRIRFNDNRFKFV